MMFVTRQPFCIGTRDWMSFRRISTQFIAALGNPGANSGSGAQSWGLWSVDPGPRGVWLSSFEQLKKAGGIAPAGWKLDQTDWWMEEHGLIMEPPEFPVPPGRYLVTGDREVTTVLTVHPADAHGDSRWELGDQATLYDVTHLPCRAARYRSTTGGCSPASIAKTAFPVAPGGAMPPVKGCEKIDYAVIFVIGLPLRDDRG